MNKVIIRLLLVLLPATMLFALSCSKSDSSSSQAPSKFTWTYDGVTYIAKQDTAYMHNLLGPSIIAGLETSIYAPGSGPRITLTSLNVGTYSFGPGSTNIFRFVDLGGYDLEGIAGSLTITMNVNKLLGGNFSVDLTNGKKITGEFTNTTIKD